MMEIFEIIEKKQRSAIGMAVLETLRVLADAQGHPVPGLSKTEKMLYDICRGLYESGF